MRGTTDEPNGARSSVSGASTTEDESHPTTCSSCSDADYGRLGEGTVAEETGSVAHVLEGL